MYRQKGKSTRPSSEPNKTKRKVNNRPVAASRRLSNLEVAEFMIKNNIRRSTELYAVAKERKAMGDKDLAEFILSCSSKTLQRANPKHLGTRKCQSEFGARGYKTNGHNHNSI